jgi:hypothetical protein
MDTNQSFGKRAQALIASEESKAEAINPANSAEQKLDAAKRARSRIPMSVPRAKLHTPEIPGFHVHWLNDYPGRIIQAMDAGYSFVESDQAVITSNDLAGSPIGSGSDLGSRISVVVGKNEDGSPLRAYLMKIPNEYHKEDQQASQDRVDQVHEAMRQGKQQVDGDNSHRYVKSVNMQSTYSRRG